jgi:hypothetical protein
MGEALDPLVAANESLADLSTEVGLGAIGVVARAIGVVARAIPVGLGRFVKKLDGNVGIGSFLGGCVFCATRHG